MMRLLFILLFFILVGCKEFVTSDFPDYESIPTVNSILVEGNPLFVHVSLTGGLDSFTLPVINDAEIYLYINGIFGEHLHYSENGIFTSKTIIEPEKEYKCIVKIPNWDTIICSQKVPKSCKITKVEHINIAGRNEEGNTYPAVKITFPNDKKERKYFEVKMKRIHKYNYEGKIVPQTVWMTAITDPVLLNEGMPLALFSNEIIDDSVYTMTMNYSGGGSSSKDGVTWRTDLYPFVIELRSVTYEYYRYKKQHYLYEQGTCSDGLTNTVAPSPLYSNIENGNGIFAGYSVFATDTITPEPYED